MFVHILFCNLDNVTLIRTKVHSVTNFKNCNFIENERKLNLKKSFNIHSEKSHSHHYIHGKLKIQNKLTIMDNLRCYYEIIKKVAVILLLSVHVISNVTMRCNFYHIADS